MLGIFVVLVGAADLCTRVSKAALGEDAALQIFGPVGVAQLAEGAATSTARGPFVPARLKVPALGVDALVEQVGRKADGTMGAPQKFNEVAWYALGGKPGGEGNAVFAGHINNGLTTAGVFEHLAKIHLGDYITVEDEAGKTLIYKVSDIQQYPVEEAPATTIFSASGPSHLVLITCDGQWVPEKKTFDKRLVVFAAPAR